MRNSNIEILRIIAILMVIISHISYHGFYTDMGYAWIGNATNRYFLEIVNLGPLGVDFFVLITGYFLVHDLDLKAEKVVFLLVKVIFYSIFMYFIALILGYATLTPKEVLSSLMPTTFVAYWFFTAYISLYLLHPFINKALLYSENESLRKRNHLYVMIVMSLLWIFPHTIMNANLSAGNICMFIMLYTMGAYIRLYLQGGVNFKQIKNIAITCIIVWLVLPIVFNNINLIGIPISSHLLHFYSARSVLSVALASCIVVLISNRPKFCNRIINKIASSVFAAYLITDNIYFREHAYLAIGLRGMSENIILIPCVMILTISLFAMSFMIDRYLGGVFCSYVSRKINIIVFKLKDNYNKA